MGRYISLGCGNKSYGKRKQDYILPHGSFIRCRGIYEKE